MSPGGGVDGCTEARLRRRFCIVVFLDEALEAYLAESAQPTYLVHTAPKLHQMCRQPATAGALTQRRGGELSAVTAQRPPRDGRSPGTKPATKEAFPAKLRSRLLATTGPLSARRVQASWKSFSLFFGGILAVAQCSPATNRAPIHSVVRPPVAFPPRQRESGGKRPHKCHGESGCRGTGAPRRVERVIDVDLEPDSGRRHRCRRAA